MTLKLGASSIYNKKPDPKHHNTGRKPSPKTELSAAVNWWVHFQLKSGIGNFRRAAAMVLHHRHFDKLDMRDKIALQALVIRQRNLLDELEDVQREVAEWNVNKRWVD